MIKPDKKIRVAELFAGVGGFRLGLNGKASPYEFVFSNQWEPGKKRQHASNCYVKHFGHEGHVCGDIAMHKHNIPDHDLLVGGFPCQDYSVATTQAKGIAGKKGVLWWEINDILTKNRPSFVLLENVDRLLKSPVKQRGRDFGVILACLNKLSYTVEWRVINAADYGFPQKRRRVFIFAAQKNTEWARHMTPNSKDPSYLYEHGFFSQAFPCEKHEDNISQEAELNKDILEVSNSFSFGFQNAGIMSGSKIFSTKVASIQEKKTPLKKILVKDPSEKYFIDPEDLERWKYVKGPKAEQRSTKEGFQYKYTEGGLPFPDNLNEPARTILTGEGGLSPTRSKHIIFDKAAESYRVLTPVEAERLNGFPDNWTEGMPEGWRFFCMGNALVVGLVERMGKVLRQKA